MPDPKTLHRTLDGAIAVAIDDEGELSDAILGKLAFFQISNDLRVTPDRLAEYFEFFGIDEVYLPRPIDARRVVNSVLTIHPKAPGRDRLWLIGDYKWELKFWVEQKQDGSIEGPLVRRRRRSQEERRRGQGEWEQVTVATVVWDSEAENPEDALGFSIAEGHADEYPYDEIFAAIDEDYRDQLSHYTGAHVASSVKKLLVDTISLPVRQAGGVWVIPRDAIDTLDRVERLIDALIAPPTGDDGQPLPGYEDNGKTQFLTVPLADGNKERLLIRGAVETRVLKELSAAITRLNELRKTGLPAKPSELAEANSIRRRALEIRNHYKNVVDVELGNVVRMLGDFDSLYAAAMSGERDVPEPDSIRLIDEDVSY